MPLIPRDGTVGDDSFTSDHNAKGFHYNSPGFNKLAAQRPRILMAALKERRLESKAVLYSDVDAVWRQNPLPVLSKLVQNDLVGAMDDHRICTGFFMFKTRQSPHFTISPKPVPTYLMQVAQEDEVSQTQPFRAEAYSFKIGS